MTEVTLPPSTNSRDNLALAFIGSLVPDHPEFQNPAFNRAGNMFQENLLLGLAKAGLPASLILSQRSLRAFPHSRRLWVKPKKVKSNNSLPIDLIPFLNLPLLRPVTVGFMVLLRLIRWGWQQRGAAHRIIYTFNLTEPSGVFSLLGARLIRARAIASVNDINVPGETVSLTLSRRFDYYLHKKLLPHFDGLLVVNKSIIDHFAPRAPFICIEGGISEGFIRQVRAAASRKAENRAPFVIASAGTLYKINGILEMLAAFPLLSGGEFRLRIAGTGPMSETVRKAAQDNPLIEYCGYLSLDEVIELYVSADVLINMRLTKLIKTDYFFPSKFLEFLASGTPVITTCTAHIEESYSGHAFLLHDESAQGLAKMIRQVAAMSPEGRRQKGRMAQEYAMDHFTWETQGRRAFQFLRERCGLNPDRSVSIAGRMAE